MAAAAREYKPPRHSARDRAASLGRCLLDVRAHDSVPLLGDYFLRRPLLRQRGEHGAS